MDQIQVKYPDWAKSRIDWRHSYHSDEDRMRLVLEITRQNAMHHTGGPFGAAIFQRRGSRLVSVGMNQVLESKNPLLHGPVVAIMMACGHVGCHDLRSHADEFELFVSCEPCSMCLTAALLSGVRRLVCAATSEDASNLGFERGPIDRKSFDYLRKAGVELQHKVLRLEARRLMEDHVKGRGVDYHATMVEH